MPFDPFGVQAYHDEVRRKIERDNEPGFAQSDDIRGMVVSFEVNDGVGSLTHQQPIHDMSQDEKIEELILDVAQGQGLASDRVFHSSRVDWMIKDRRAYPTHWTKKHKQADLLEAYYVNGPGQRHLY